MNGSIDRKHKTFVIYNNDYQFEAIFPDRETMHWNFMVMNRDCKDIEFNEGYETSDDYNVTVTNEVYNSIRKSIFNIKCVEFCESELKTKLQRLISKTEPDCWFSARPRIKYLEQIINQNKFN